MSVLIHETLLDGSVEDRIAPANVVTMLQAAQNALANNQTFLGLAAPTNAQVVAQVQALTRQMDALIRLRVGAFDATT